MTPLLPSSPVAGKIGQASTRALSKDIRRLAVKLEVLMARDSWNNARKLQTYQVLKYVYLYKIY